MGYVCDIFWSQKETDANEHHITERKAPRVTSSRGFSIPGVRVGLILFVALFLLGQLFIDMVGNHTGYNRNTERKQIIEHHITSFCAELPEGGQRIKYTINMVFMQTKSSPERYQHSGEVALLIQGRKDKVIIP